MIDYENLGKLNQPFFKEFEESFHKTLTGGWYVLGKNVETFENEFASFTGSKYCLGVASGLDALILSLKAFNFQSGDEVIVPSNTYIASIIAIIHAGLKPVLVEPNIDTYNIDPLKIEEKITSKTKAILVVHLYGKSCEMDKITAICKKHQLKLVEDCAQSHGAKFKDKQTGTFGEFGCFSYYPTKNLGAIGDAGSITTYDIELLEKVKMLRNYGSKVKYVNDVVGYNSRLDEIQAGFLSIKLKKLNDINQHKRKLASIYLSNLKSDFIKPIVHPDYFDVYHIFNIRHEKRDELRDYLLKNEIKTEIHYPIAPHKQLAMRGILDNQNYPLSEEIHQTTLSLPISYFHTEDDINKVIDVMNKF
ncbi:MAG: DegT/DnrJ/EryC1/StrS family aminotransferase [Flavobacteriales bacterium]|nr:DegT/DnrJ/EryC1/StrS family aminotransferase [Flavobacteriales bacterium]